MMKPLILIIDPDCPKPYSDKSMAVGPLGGTEATIVRVSVGLAARGYRVVVAQGSRQQEEVSREGLSFIPLHWEKLPRQYEAPQAVLMLNTPKLLSRIRRFWSAAKLFLWIHCFPGKRRRKILNKWTVATNTCLVAVSQTLATELREYLQEYPNYGRHKHTEGKRAPVTTAYNPIDDALQPDDSAVDPHKLVFFSSPHKGLEQVLKAFSAAKRHFPKLKLYLANPGYWPMPPNVESKDVVVLGALRHEEVMQHVREAFCVFYPQSRFKETFGLVFAEANALGTPVLTHPLAAAPEVLENKQQLVDVTDTKRVVERLREWYQEGRPAVKLPEKYRLKSVLTAWETLLMKEKAGSQHDENPYGKNINSKYKNTGKGTAEANEPAGKGRANDSGKPERGIRRRQL